MTVERFKIPDGKQLHPERATVLGASEIAAAAGVDPYKSMLQLFLEKTGQLPPQGETATMRRGRLGELLNEAYLLDEMPGVRIINPRVWLLDRVNRMGATPDRLMEDPETGDLINVQMKLTAKREFEKWNGTPPLAYQLQCTQEAMLLDAHSSLLSVLVMTEFEAELELFTIPRHAPAEERIRDIARAFWERVASNELPAADYTKDTEILARLYPPTKAVPVPLDLTGDNRVIELLSSRETHKAAVKAAEAELEAIDAEIVDKLKGAELATVPGWKITRKMQHRGEYIVAAKDYPVMRVTRVAE